MATRTDEEGFFKRGIRRNIDDTKRLASAISAGNRIAASDRSGVSGLRNFAPVNAASGSLSKTQSTPITQPAAQPVAQPAAQPVAQPAAQLDIPGTEQSLSGAGLRRVPGYFQTHGAVVRGGERVGGRGRQTVLESPSGEAMFQNEDGSTRRPQGAFSVIDSPYSANNLSKPENAGLRELIENADIRAGRTEPRPSEAVSSAANAKNQIDLARLQFDVAKFGEENAIARANLRFRGEDQLLDRIEKVIPTDTPDENLNKRNALAQSKAIQFIDRYEGDLDRNAQQKILDLARLSPRAAELARRNSRLFGAGIIGDFFEFFGATGEDPGTAADPVIASGDLKQILDDFKNPEKDTLTYRGRSIPKQSSFFTFGDETFSRDDLEILASFKRHVKENGIRRGDE